ncbi:MAG TPA: hypothetical protein VK530_09915 [Candidatus Acidoferrum sp.]|nr:hypothetical protein [Candidatus Acidoferrum sp.]
MRAKVFKKVPKAEVGEFVQLHIDAGAKCVTVVPNSDGLTCTVKVES